MVVINSDKEFFELQRKFKKIPYSQSIGWFNYNIAQNRRVIFFVDSEQESKIACWGIEFRIPYIKKIILRIEGECFNQDINENELENFYAKLLTLPYEAIEIDSNSNYNIKFEIGLRLAGFKRPIGQFNCPLSIEIDLNQESSYNRNWKGNIKKAEKLELYFQEVLDINQKITVLISELFKEMAGLKGLQYSLEPESIKALLISDDIRTFIAFDKENNPLAVNILHIDHPWSTLIFSINNLKAREFGGSHFLVSNVINLLKLEGFEALDFCRIPPSNHSTNGIYIFKSGSGGNKIQYNGEWAFYKNSYIEGLVYLYKKLILKKQRY